ncbi:MAG: PIN domain-containing protein [Candidatus Bathyarchaeia archaeon]
MSLIVLDTGVIAEYANIGGSYNAQAAAIFKSINEGRLEASLAPPTVTELYYVMKRVYETERGEDASKRAHDFCKYVYYHPGIRVADLDFDLLVGAGRVKADYGVAITDCYVLSLSKQLGCKALFRHREVEMRPVLDRMLKEFQVIFLEDYGR